MRSATDQDAAIAGARWGVIMQTYEIRLLNGEGGTVLLHLTQCATDGDARDCVRRIRDVPYDRYELWSGLCKIDEGPRPADI
jgi:hypothetical protein